MPRSLRAAPEEMQRAVLEKGVLTGRNQSMILVSRLRTAGFQPSMLNDAKGKKELYDTPHSPPLSSPG